MKVAIVTPTIGQDCLTKCLLSVQNQSYEGDISMISFHWQTHRNQNKMLNYHF